MAFSADYNRKHKITLDSGQVSADLTDFSVLLLRDAFDDEVVDPSGANASQADGGDIVLTSDEAGSNRLAIDVISWEHDSTTGAGDAALQVRVLVPSVLSASDSEIWVWYNSDVAESQPGPTDTFGAYNAYDANWGGYWPNGGILDRTVNQFDFTDVNGTITKGGLSGKVLDATEMDGTSYFKRTATPVSGSGDRTYIGWISGISGDSHLFNIGPNGSIGGTGERWSIRNDAGNLRIEVQGGGYTSSLSSPTTGTYAQVAVRLNGTTLGDHTLFVDASSEAATGTTTINTTDEATYVGIRTNEDSAGDFNNDEAQIHTTARSDAWITTERNQANTPATFTVPGTPEDAATVTTTTLTFDQGSYSVTGQDFALRQVEVLSFEQGTYTITGSTAELVETDIIEFNQGSYSITGQDIGFKQTDILSFQQGAYSITGQDIGLVSVDVLDFQQGSYAITGNDIGFITSTTTTMTFGQGSYSITGQDIGLKQVDVLSFGQGNYAISGQDIGLKKVDILSFDQGSYNVSGQPIGFVEIKVLDFEQGTYSITGQDFRIVISSPEVLTLDSTIATFIELDSEITKELNLDSKI